HATTTPRRPGLSTVGPVHLRYGDMLMGAHAKRRAPTPRKPKPRHWWAIAGFAFAGLVVAGVLIVAGVLAVVGT
ncbi:MAG: hypothetical protein ACRDP8_13845, partial [Actinopolymorphaceae bacterium]